MNRTSSRRATTPGRIRPPALEPRRLLSAGVVDGTLRVVGSTAATTHATIACGPPMAATKSLPTTTP